MNLEKLLEELTSPGAPIAASRLVQLSALGPEEARYFTEGWLEVPAERRRAIASKLMDLSEDNVELDFSPIFRKLLHDDDEQVRVTAISGLWECEERALIEPLVHLALNDPDEAVRGAAAQALGRFALLAETGKLLKRDFERLAKVLLGIINDEDETLEVRRRAIEAIAPMSISQVPDLIRNAFEDGEPKLRASF